MYTSFPCYFLLNVVWTSILAWRRLSRDSSLLFSFECCPPCVPARGGRAWVPLETCYFLLNVVKVERNDVPRDIYKLTCYFLLNVVSTNKGYCLSQPTRWGLLFSFECCLHALSRLFQGLHGLHAYYFLLNVVSF